MEVERGKWEVGRGRVEEGGEKMGVERWAWKDGRGERKVGKEEMEKGEVEKGVIGKGRWKKLGGRRSTKSGKRR
jgi:hypothetical protein